MKHFFFYSILILFLTVNLNCKKENNNPPTEGTSVMEHPRLLLLKDEEEKIRDLIDSDETWKKLHFTILEQCNEILGKPVLTRKMIGRRLLSTSREFWRRVFFLSYSYRMTKTDKFLKRAVDEMMAVAQFTDWNPSHFLDVAEMTMGMAIGYDWLYDELSTDNKKILRDAILHKGINPSKNSDHNWWLRSSHNWNQVCNTGMAYGVLAIQEDFPELATEIINRAFETIPLSMQEYGPDGVYPEGYGYWGYGTTYNVLFLSAFAKLNTDIQDLVTIPGFMETGNYLNHMHTPTGSNFNWGDNSGNTNLKTAMFWFAQHKNNPSMLWSEKRFLDQSNFSSFKWIRSLPAMLIWAKDIALADITTPHEKFWMGQGDNPVAMMRSSWTDPNALYLGFKAGSPAVNHGHMDIGSFVMEADGRRWATDLGVQNYESLESLGMKIFEKTQDAQRWTIFRMNTYAHNVLIIDNEQQRVDGYAKIDKYSDAEEFMFAVSDISSVYNTQLKKATRGVGVKNGAYTIIRDEIETLDKITLLRWNMVTPTNVSLGNSEATLTNDGKSLHLKVLGPDNLQMKTWSTAPTNNYDAENPGTILVGFECELPANSEISFEVILVPEKVKDGSDFLNLKLEEW